MFIKVFFYFKMIKFNKASNNKLKSTKLTKLYSIAQK